MMYCLLIWDTDLAASEHDGCLAKLPIPTDLAKQLIQLDARTFPSLSTLGFDDYDIFSGEEIDTVIGELDCFAATNLIHAEFVKKMIDLASDARSLGGVV